MSSYNGDDFPEELIIWEILTRLPIKSLFRFKLVCKKWNNLITHNNPLFATTHHSHNIKNLSSSSFFFGSHECVISSTNSKMSKPSFIKRFLCVKGSTNGLLYGFCCRYTEIFICNPITKHVVYLPNPTCLMNIALAVDPYNNPNFGFAIIAIINNKDGVDPNHFKFRVYSSKTDEWRVSDAELLVPSHELLRKYSPVFTERKVYWSLVRHMAWFDVKADVAGVIQCPNHNNLVFHHPSQAGTYSEIGVCNGGELSYSKITKEGDIEIWLLRNNREDHQEFEWVKRHNVSLQDIVRQNCHVMSKSWHNMNVVTLRLFARQHSFFPLPYLNGEVVWFCMLVKGYGFLYSINLRNRELKVINGSSPKKVIDGDFFLPSLPFTATLLPCPT